jgi:hypothetical protein
MGAAALIAAGTSHSDTTIGRALSLRPLVWIGGLSYSIYLFHWPMVVGAEALFGQPLSPWVGTTVVTLSILPAWISYRFVEDPLRHSERFVTPPSRGVKLGLAMTLSGALIGIGLFGVVRWQESGQTSADPSIDTQPLFLEDSSDDTKVGIDPDSVPEIIDRDDLIPPLTSIEDDIPATSADGCHQNQADSEPLNCEYGNPEGPTVVLVGDSHAAQWSPAVTEIAEQEGWNLVLHTKSACPFGTMVTGRDGGVYESCVEWNRAVLEEIMDERPALVITSSSTTNLPVDADGGTLSDAERADRYLEGLLGPVRSMEDVGIDVALIADTPRPRRNVPECLATTDLVSECTVSIGEALVPDIHRSVAELVGDTTYINMTPWICTDELCPPIVDNVVVWRDTHHITATYALALAPVLSARLPAVDS